MRGRFMRMRRRLFTIVIPAAGVLAATRPAIHKAVACNPAESSPADEPPMLDAPESIDLAVPPRPIRVDDDIDDATRTDVTRSVRTFRRQVPSSPRQLISDTVERLRRVDGNFHWANVAWQRGDGPVAREWVRRVLSDAPENRAATELLAICHDAALDAAEASLRCRRFDTEWRAVYERYLDPLRFSATEAILAELQGSELTEGLRLKYLDVKSILANMPELRPTEIFLSDASYVPADAPEAPELRPPTASFDELICEAIDPETWFEEGTALALRNGTLIVKNLRGTIERVSQLVYALRAGLPPVKPDIEVHFGGQAGIPVYGDRGWQIVDLVGHASADGTVAPANDDAPPPFTPGALLAALRAGIEDSDWNAPGSTVRLVDGTLSVHMDAAAIQRVGALLEAVRARVHPPPDLDDFDCEVTCD